MLNSHQYLHLQDRDQTFKKNLSPNLNPSINKTFSKHEKLMKHQSGTKMNTNPEYIMRPNLKKNKNKRIKMKMKNNLQKCSLNGLDLLNLRLKANQKAKKINHQRLNSILNTSGKWNKKVLDSKNKRKQKMLVLMKSPSL